MSLSSRSNQYGKVLGDWNIRKEIGRGSNETIVYQIVRKNKNWEEFCALKAIPIIDVRGDYNILSDRRKEEYQKALSERSTYVMNEVWLMFQVGNRTNIVDYKDRGVVEWEDENGFGCDLLIRMELLHDLKSELERGRIFSEAEVIQIGKDICSALVICHRKGILHRDIKPANIFFNEDGDYKLGDFSIARILDKCLGSYASTQTGTPGYLAPEQLEGKYDMRVDIYSLGLVLYELANQNRLPFAESSYVRPEEVNKRIHAKKLLKPCDASDELSEIILTACAHEPADRYQSAQEMLNALRQIHNAIPAKRRLPTVSDLNTTIDSLSTGSSYDTEPALPDFVRIDPNQSIDVQQPKDPEGVCKLRQKANANGKVAKSSKDVAQLPKSDNKVSPIDEDPFDDIFKIFKRPAAKDAGKVSMEPTTLPVSKSTNEDFIIEDGVLVKYCGHDENVVLPEGIVEIGAGAFRESQLESISIGADVKRIGENAFLRCQNLISITLPDSVTSIADSAFGLCIGLTNINVASENSEYISVDGVLFNMNRAILHTYPCGKSGQSYRIPSFVTSIGKRAFKGCESLTSITIPDSVTCIGDCAFYACHHLTDVIISNGITYVGDKAFCECLSLTSVTIPNSVTSIGDYAFYGCLSLTSVTIPNSVTSIGDYAFDMCHTLTDIYYGGSEGQWKEITVNEGDNELLTVANIHYNSTGMAQAQEFSDGIPLAEVNEETLGIPIDDLIDMTESSGDALDQFVLGLYYMNGSGVSKDEVTAAKWFKKAAEQGLDKAQCILGLHYMYGIGVSRDETIATEWLTKAAVQGDAVAQCYLGNCYEGLGVYQDETIAVEWLAKAAERGDKYAQFGLGFLYMAGNGVSKNEAIAVEWLTKAAKQGYEDAQYLLGECYMKGVGFPQDEAMAVEWFTKAAKQNHVAAERRWGICLLSGNGTPRNTTKAAEWLSKAASQGDSEAQILLGCCYMFGEGVPKNLEKAIGWYSKAADQEVSDAQYILGFCYEHGEGIPANISAAVQWYTKSAEQGNAYAQRALRKCCSVSKGTIKDYLKSVVFHVKAEEREDSYIQEIFCKHAGMYEKGG